MTATAEVPTALERQTAMATARLLAKRQKAGGLSRDPVVALYLPGDVLSRLLTGRASKMARAISVAKGLACSK